MPRVLGWYPLHAATGTPGVNRFGVDTDLLGRPVLNMGEGIVPAGPNSVATFGGGGPNVGSISVFTYEADGALTFVDGLQVTGNAPMSFGGAPGYVATITRSGFSNSLVSLFAVDDTGITPIYTDIFLESEGGTAAVFYYQRAIAADETDGSVWAFVSVGVEDTGDYDEGGRIWAWHILADGTVATPVRVWEADITGRPVGPYVERSMALIGAPTIINGAALVPFRVDGDPVDPNTPYRARGVARFDPTAGATWEIDSTDSAAASLSDSFSVNFLPGGRSGDVAPFKEGFMLKLDSTPGPVAADGAGSLLTDASFVADALGGSWSAWRVHPVSRDIDPTGAVNVLVDEYVGFDPVAHEIRTYRDGAYPGTGDDSYTSTIIDPLTAQAFRSRFMLWEDNARAWIYPGQASRLPLPADGWDYPDDWDYADWDYGSSPGSVDFLFLVDFEDTPSLTVGFLQLGSR